MSPALDMLLKTEYDRGYAEGEALGYTKGEEICRRIMDGESNSAIAKELNIDKDEVQHFRKYIEPAN